MEKIESTIRDYLASNIAFISPDLRVIKTEFHLTPPHGTARGYIDILCIDSQSNRVIIEIKRSEQTARQTFTEVFKYTGLLKQNLRVRDGEIRIIIISTVWKGLIIPFSEFCNASRYIVEGFKIDLNEDNIPVNKKIMIPVENVMRRNISATHLIYLYRNKEKREKAIPLIKNQMKDIGLVDFILVKQSNEIMKKHIRNHYAIYVAFQRYQEEYYRELLEQTNQLDEYEGNKYSEDEDKEIFLRDIEQLILCNLNFNFYDEFELGNPEKFLTETKDNGWKIDQIIKEGFLNNDPGLSDEMIQKELQGLTGESITHYYNYASSKSKARVDEIHKSSLKYLKSLPIWKNHLDCAFQQAKQKNGKYDITIAIYTPSESILYTLFKIYNCIELGSNSPLHFLPIYIFQVCYPEENKTITYQGQIKWNHSNISYNDFVNKVFKGNDIWFVTEDYYNRIPWLRPKVKEYLGFEYTSDVTIIKNDKSKTMHDITISGCNYQPSNSSSVLYTNDFIQKSQDFLEKSSRIYRGYIISSLKS